MGLLGDIFGAIEKGMVVTDKVANLAGEMEDIKEGVEAVKARSVLGFDLIERGRDLKLRLDRRAEADDPPGTISFVGEVGEFLLPPREPDSEEP